jgi:hypothetical protein
MARAIGYSSWQEARSKYIHGPGDLDGSPDERRQAVADAD